jgi:hypothetical protein
MFSNLIQSPSILALIFASESKPSFPMVCRERERILREVESVTHCAIDIGESLRIVSEVNWGRRGDIRKRGKWQRDTVRDRTRGRNAESSGEGREQLSARDRQVIDRPEIFGCDEAGADLMVDSDRFNFLSFGIVL